MEISNVTCGVSGILSRWIVPEKGKIIPGSPIAEVVAEEGAPPAVIESTVTGKLKKHLVKEGSQVSSGSDIASLEVCTHPALYKNMCVSCGVKLSSISSSSTSSATSQQHSNLTVSGGHTIKVSAVEAKRRQQSKMDTLKSSQKLALVLDLDATLLHATANPFHPTEMMELANPLTIEENGRHSRYYCSLYHWLFLFLL